MEVASRVLALLVVEQGTGSDLLAGLAFSVGFVALDTGRAPFGWLAWLTWLGWLVLANMVGGLGLTTLLRLVRSRKRLADHQAVAAERATAAERAATGPRPP